MNNAEHIWTLMARKLSGEASFEEISELEEILRENPHASYSKEILHDIWQAIPDHDSQYAENRYKELAQQIKNMGIDEGRFNQEDHFINESPKFKGAGNFRKMVLVAAGFIFIVAVSYLYFANSATAVKELTESHVKNEINTKNGSKTNLVLPDGTKVWLNSSSQLTYDKNYGGKLREVNLVGEAYFDVVKNAQKPFIIHTNKMDIKVLGTVFNVKCYPGEKTIETSLIRGSIEVTLKDRQEKIMLKPNEKLVINNQEETAVKKSDKQEVQSNIVIEKPLISLSHLTFYPVDNTVVETAWVQNRLVFSSETFEDVALKMERWYNVKILFADESLKQTPLTGSFEKETFIEALNALQIATRFSYSIKNDTITINKHTNFKK